MGSPLTTPQQEDLDAVVRLLQAHGPALERPHVDRLQGSRLHNLKELRYAVRRPLAHDEYTSLAFRKAEDHLRLIPVMLEDVADRLPTRLRKLARRSGERSGQVGGGKLQRWSALLADLGTATEDVAAGRDVEEVCDLGVADAQVRIGGFTATQLTAWRAH